MADYIPKSIRKIPRRIFVYKWPNMNCYAINDIRPCHVTAIYKNEKKVTNMAYVNDTSVRNDLLVKVTVEMYDHLLKRLDNIPDGSEVFALKLKGDIFRRAVRAQFLDPDMNGWAVVFLIDIGVTKFLKMDSNEILEIYSLKKYCQSIPAQAIRICISQDSRAPEVGDDLEFKIRLIDSNRNTLFVDLRLKQEVIFDFDSVQAEDYQTKVMEIKYSNPFSNWRKPIETIDLTLDENMNPKEPVGVEKPSVESFSMRKLLESLDENKNPTESVDVKKPLVDSFTNRKPLEMLDENMNPKKPVNIEKPQSKIKYCNTYHPPNASYKCNLIHRFQLRKSEAEQSNTIVLPKEGDVLKLFPVCILDDAMFYAHLDKNVANELENLHKSIRDFEPKMQKVRMPVKGQIILCLYGILYFRAKILGSINHEYSVLFVDYGVTETVNESKMAMIDPQFLKLPFQAVLCQIWNVKVVEGKEERLKDELSSKLLNKEIKATVVAVENQKLLVNISDDEDFEDYRQELIMFQLAIEKSQ